MGIDHTVVWEKIKAGNQAQGSEAFGRFLGLDRHKKLIV